MNRIYTTVLGLAALGFLGNPAAQAQDAPQRPNAERRQGGQNAQRNMLVMIPADYMATELKLETSQKDKIKAIQDKLATESKSLRPAEGQAFNRETMQKMRDMQEQAVKDIQAVLNTDQKDRAEKLAREVGGLQQIGIPVATLADLKLTSDQMAKLKDVVQEMQSATRELSREERMQKMRELRRTAQEKANGILTAEQKATIEKYNKENPGPGRRARRSNAEADPS